MSRLTLVCVVAALILLVLGFGATRWQPPATVLAQPHAKTVLPEPGQPATALADMLKASPCVPAIEFTRVPVYASYDNLFGQVHCLDFAAHRVAVYIYVNGWWNKPTWASPLTPIAADGTWTTDVTTGGIDPLATQYAAFVVPSDYVPPTMAGGEQLTPLLYKDAIAWVVIDRPPILRTIEFSGYTWNVKASDSAIGPGPNRFSEDPQDVWVDEQGRLHLRLAFRDGYWYCTEIISQSSFGHGQYIFGLAPRERQLDKNAVLGLFTWDSLALEHNYREIDVELSRWGDSSSPNTQYVVQPWYQSGNMYRFESDLAQGATTHRFRWLPQQILFESLAAPPSPGADSTSIASWTYTGADLPPAGGENARINFWLMDGLAPSDGLEDEIVIESFEFIALPLHLPLVQAGMIPQ